MAIGLGCLRLHEAADPQALVHAALAAGLRVLDVADVYGAQAGDAEERVASALASWSGRRDDVVVVSKGGLKRTTRSWDTDGRAKHLGAAAAASVERLGRVDLYLLHAPDPRTKLSTSVRALAKLHKEGVVGRLGLCNITLEQLEEAQSLMEVAAVQVRLSPFHSASVDDGLVGACLDTGISVLAHSPFGGHRSHARVAKNRVLTGVAKRHGVSPYDVVTAWLEGLGVVPLVGCTRIDSLPQPVELDSSDWAVLDEAFPHGARLRGTWPTAPDAELVDGEVVLLMGMPGAGKSSRVQAWVDRGYSRLNRDLEGGTLKKLADRLRAELSAGRRHWVLDNTYPTRATRRQVIEAAWAHEVPVRCVWLQTGLEDAQRNTCTRMVRAHGRLLEPDEMAESKVPNDFPPMAQFRYRRQLEPPRELEGFSAIDAVPFERTPSVGQRGALIFDYVGTVWARIPTGVDDIELVPGIARRLAAEPRPLISVSWLPAEDWPPDEVRAVIERTHELLGVDVLATWCPHAPGPPVCWCRKPLPGLGVYVTELCGLDPAKCTVLVRNAADKGFAERCGFGVEE